MQVVPSIAGVADHVTLFQREPGWVLPKPDRDLSDDERARLRRRGAQRRERLRQFWLIEIGQMFGSLHRPGTKINSIAESRCRTYIVAVFADRPDLAEAVTPKYPFPGKRPVLTKDFYPALLRDDVELVPHAVASITATGVVDVRGVEHPADVLVMATGFQPANYLASYRVVGRAGRTLHEFWNGEPQAFAGITVPEFPNFYILYGPNTNGGEIISALQRQAEFAVRSIKRLRDENMSAIEVRPWFYRRYNRWIQGAIAKTALGAGQQLLQVTIWTCGDAMALRRNHLHRGDQISGQGLRESTPGSSRPRADHTPPAGAIPQEREAENA